MRYLVTLSQGEVPNGRTVPYRDFVSSDENDNDQKAGAKGGGVTAKIIDLGLAKTVDESASEAGISSSDDQSPTPTGPLVAQGPPCTLEPGPPRPIFLIPAVAALSPSGNGIAEFSIPARRDPARRGPAGQRRRSVLSVRSPDRRLRSVTRSPAPRPQSKERSSQRILPVRQAQSPTTFSRLVKTENAAQIFQRRRRRHQPQLGNGWIANPIRRSWRIRPLRIRSP
jgi:hypothetical protein